MVKVQPTFDFARALEHLRAGKIVKRRHWGWTMDGIVIQDGDVYPFSHANGVLEDQKLDVASYDNILADDWVVVDPDGLSWEAALDYAKRGFLVTRPGWTIDGISCIGETVCAMVDGQAQSEASLLQEDRDAHDWRLVEPDSQEKGDRSTSATEYRLAELERKSNLDAEQITRILRKVDPMEKRLGVFFDKVTELERKFRPTGSIAMPDGYVSHDIERNSMNFNAIKVAVQQIESDLKSLTNEPVSVNSVACDCKRTEPEDDGEGVNECAETPNGAGGVLVLDVILGFDPSKELDRDALSVSQEAILATDVTRITQHPGSGYASIVVKGRADELLVKHSVPDVASAWRFGLDQAWWARQ